MAPGIPSLHPPSIDWHAPTPLPPHACASQAPSHRFRHTERAIFESFGMHFSELFDWMERTPVASGSIGQIHRARLSAKGAALTGVQCNCGGPTTSVSLKKGWH